MLKPGTLRRVEDYYLTQRDVAERIMPRAVKEFFNCKTDAQYEEALRSLSDDIYAHGQFNEWLIFDFAMDNAKSMIANFLVDNGDNISAAERNLYKKLLETNHYSLYEVLDVKRGVGLSLCDMHTGKKYEVSEYSATFDLNVGNIFYARLAQVDDRYEMVSADSKVMDVRFSERFRDMMRQTEKSNKKKKHLTPKDTYNSTLDDSSNTANPAVDPVLAEKRLQDILEKQGMTKHISVEKICTWIKREKDPMGSSHIVSIICGLTRNTLDKSDIDELMVAVSDLWNSHPHDSLAGRSPQDMKTERVYHNEHEVQTDFVADITPLGGLKCWDAANKATKLLKSGKYRKALEKYQETFRLMLEEKATIPDIYRIYANKGLAHLLIGQEIEGVRMLEMAGELNPNYTFAKEQLDHYRSGEMADDIQAGFLEAARERFEDPDSSLRKWNPDSVGKRYSTDEIFDLLRSNGIILDEPSFKDLLQEYVDISDLADKELYPKYTGEEKDEDMVWATATVLASRLAPDAFHVDGLIDAILETEEHIIDNGLLDSKKSLWHLATMKRYSSLAPEKLFTKWQTYSEYPRQASLIVEVALLCLGTPKEQEVIGMCDGFMNKTGDATFMIPKIYTLIAHEDQEWTIWYKKLKEKLPYDPYAEVIISRAFGDKGDHENTEKHVRLAVTSAEKGIKEKVRKGSSRKDMKRAIAEQEQSYTDLEYALDNLRSFLNRHKKKDEGKIVSKRLSEVRKARRDLSQDRIKILQESVERETKEMAKKSLSADPAVVYFNYVREIGIDYSTAEQVGINISTKSPTGEKIGRNDPCPCGSNKKFKRCHGK